MTNKQIIKQLAERYKEICKNPFADGYTFKAFEGRCAEQGFTIDDVRNYIEKEKQERKTKRAESIKSLKEQLKRKEQEYEELRKYHNKCCEEFENEKQKLIDKYNQFSKDFFIGKYCKKEYCELLKAKEQECEELKKELQAQSAFTTQEQRKIYCAAYDKTCETGNECKQKKCVFKDRLKFKQALVEIKEIVEPYCNGCSVFGCGKGGHCKYCNYSKILQKISECEVNND